MLSELQEVPVDSEPPVDSKPTVRDVAISVDKLSKCYRVFQRPQDRLIQMLTRGRKQLHSEFWALHDVSFEIEAGSTVGILGRNGAGKSTLLQMICGTLSPTSGQILSLIHI